MKRPGSRRRWIKLGILSAPFLAWALILLIVPTGWAKARLSARLAQATGRSVRIGSLHLGMLGHLRIRDVAIAGPGSPQDPWITVPEAQIDVHLGQVLMGRCNPGEIRLIGPTVRLLRRPTGAWECAEFARTKPDPKATAGAAEDEPTGSTSLVIEGGQFRVDDRASGVQFELANIAARGSLGAALATVEEFQAELNGGSVQLAARVGREAEATRFEAEVRAHGVTIDPGLNGLAYLVPMVAGSAGEVRGRLDLDISANGHGTTVEEIRRSIRGNGSVSIDPVDLVGSRFLSELDVLGEWPNDDRIGSLSCDFTIERERAVSENLTLRVAQFPLVLSGWTDFDGRFDYGVRSDRMAAMLPGDARGWLNEIRVNFDQLAAVHVRGNPSHAEATLNGRPIRGNGEPGHAGNGRDEDRTRLRDTARRIRERFFR